MKRVPPAGGASLVERRLLPDADRDAFAQEIARFHLEDLNLLAERRRAGRAATRWTPGEVSRARAIILAARWQRDGFLSGIRRFVEEGRAADGDAFGPALLLRALGAPDGAVVRRLGAGVRAQVDTLLAASAADNPLPSAPAAARVRAKRPPRPRGRRRS